MQMHFLSGGRLRMRRNVYYPDAGAEETFELPVASVLLRHARGNVLFDTGCHPDIARNAEARWGTMARFMVPVMAADDHVLTSLKRVGLEADDIDHVICSHLHTDHCGCNQFFRKAAIHVHARELAAARAAGAVRAGYLPADWDHPPPMTTFDSEFDLFDDGRIRIVELPGHTPGMVGVLARLDRDGTFLLASDAVSVRANLDENIAPKPTWNVAQCLASYARIRAFERDGAQVICGHDDAQWRALRQGVDFYS